jgi:chromosome segregation ATPase
MTLEDKLNAIFYRRNLLNDYLDKRHQFITSGLDLNTLNKNCQETERQVLSIKSCTADTQKKLDAMNREYQTLQSTKTDLHNKMVTLEKNVSQLTNELQSKQTNLDNLGHQQTNLKATIQNTKNQIAAFENKLQQFKENEQIEQEKFQKLKQDVNKMNQLNSINNNTIQSLTSDKEQILNQLNEKEDILLPLVSQWLDHHKESLKQQENNKTNLLNELENLCKTISTIKQQMEDNNDDTIETTLTELIETAHEWLEKANNIKSKWGNPTRGRIIAKATNPFA